MLLFDQTQDTCWRKKNPISRAFVRKKKKISSECLTSQTNELDKEHKKEEDKGNVTFTGGFEKSVVFLGIWKVGLVYNYMHAQKRPERASVSHVWLILKLCASRK